MGFLQLIEFSNKSIIFIKIIEKIPQGKAREKCQSLSREEKEKRDNTAGRER